MAAMKSIIFSMLFAVAVVLAEDSTTATSDESSSTKAGFMGIPGLPSFPGLPNFSSGFPSIPGLPNFPGFGSRTRREAEDEITTSVNAHNPQQEHEDRLFFNLFPTVTGCNYTATPGVSCVSCTQTLTCLSSNVGVSRTCHGLFPYCNNGRCSLFRGAACFPTTSTSSISTSSTSTSSSTPTTTTTTTTPATGQ